MLVHRSDLGEFILSSDSIAHSYTNTKSMVHIISKIPPGEVTSFFAICSTIGGYIIFPAKKIDNKMTINGARGFNRSIKDRFDLTLECIRRYYNNEDSPLIETLKRYSDFFDLFQNFKGYVDFFLLQDLIEHDYSSINFFLPFQTFDQSPLPKDIEEYQHYKRNLTDFITVRNQRIAKWSISVKG